jgi:hypothetical protein
MVLLLLRRRWRVREMAVKLSTLYLLDEHLIRHLSKGEGLTQPDLGGGRGCPYRGAVWAAFTLHMQGPSLVNHYIIMSLVPEDCAHGMSVDVRIRCTYQLQARRRVRRSPILQGDANVVRGRLWRQAGSECRSCSLRSVGQCGSAARDMVIEAGARQYAKVLVCGGPVLVLQHSIPEAIAVQGGRAAA